MRGWQRRWFILQEKCLFCFNREDDTRIANTYFLDDFDLKDVPNNPDEPDKFALELVSAKNSSADSVVLCAASEEEKKEWMKALCYHIYADKGGAIFGLALQETMKYEHKQGHAIPRMVEECVQHLLINAMEAEGIFRLAGRTGLMKELRSQYEMGLLPSLDSVDVHTVASLFKTYLRELPESLVPPAMYQRAMNHAMRYAEASSDAARTVEVKGLADMLQELPDVNYATLAYICRFLSRLAANHAVTKMDAKNLGLVFGPNLIRHMDNTPELLMVTADLAQHLTFMLISHCDVVLPCTPSKETVTAEPLADSLTVSRRIDVPSDDLLRMSQPVDYFDDCLLKPHPTSLKDLEGLNFTSNLSGQDDVFNNSVSPDNPSSPMVFVHDHFHISEGGGGSLSSSSEASVGADGNLTTKPVAPKRNRTLKKRRPPSSPASPEANRQLDSQDILQALADAGTSNEASCKSTNEETSVSETLSKQSSQETDDYPPKKNLYLTNESKSLVSNICPLLKTAENNNSMEQPKGKTEAFASYTDKLGKSPLVMEMQIAGLKTELINVKTKSESQVKALKNQMVEMKDRYDARISSMEKQQQRQMLDVTTKLQAECRARAEAVERTMSLQAQLYKYKLQYGELQS